MFTIAMIGPDGAGKTTVCQALQRTLPMPVRYMYMGVNLESSNAMLPTTRLLQALQRARGKRPDAGGPRDPDAVDRPPRGLVRRTLRKLKAAAWLMLVLSEECYRFGMAWWYMKRGCVVLCDRHFFLDYYHYDVASDAPPRALHRRIHGFLLNRVFPRPKAVIYLDAPAEVLFSRKGEGTVEILNKRRQQYQQLRDTVEHFHTLDASQSLEVVTSQAAGRIEELYHLCASGRERAAVVEAGISSPADTSG